MTSQAYREKWLYTLEQYEDLVRKNQQARTKLAEAAKASKPVSLTEEEIHSLEDERKAWEIFLELVRNPR